MLHLTSSVWRVGSVKKPKSQSNYFCVIFNELENINELENMRTFHMMSN